MTNLIGQSLGRYHILGKLGEGGMATVYKAYDTRLETDVAVKVIRTEKLTQESTVKTLKRFEREAKALARLTHPNLVKVLDYGEYEGKPYLVMPFLPGGTLKEHIRQGALPWQEALRLLLPIAEALSYAHECGIIHRDVKPSNILVTESGALMLADFGVAKILEVEETLDLTGAMGVGTPEYMSPEQFQGQVDARSDIYALGIVLYEMVTGRKPYLAETPAALIIKQATDPLPRPRQFVRDLPEAFEKVLFKALAKQPRERYQNMESFAKALEHLLMTQSKTGQGQVQKERKTQNQETSRGRDKAKLPHIPVRQLWMFAGISIAVVVFIFLATVIFRNLPLSSELPTRQSTLTIAPRTTSIQTITPTLVPTSTVMVIKTPAVTETPRAIATPTLDTGSTMIRETDGMVMVYVPEGPFIMGSNKGLDDEKPVHTVTLDAFWIDQTEVTNAMFEKFVQAVGYKTDKEKNSYCSVFNSKTRLPEQVSCPDWRHPQGLGFSMSILGAHPVVQVSWNDASAYCSWAGGRLPSEAEWEKAARGIDGRTYPWGETVPNGELLNFADASLVGTSYAGNMNTNDGYRFTAPVGSFPAGASPYGVFDMAGNVWEWVDDRFSNTYYQNSPSSNPTGPASGSQRVNRGGAWINNAKDVRSANRGASFPSQAIDVNGFRCARGATP